MRKINLLLVFFLTSSCVTSNPFLLMRVDTEEDGQRKITSSESDVRNADNTEEVLSKLR